MSDGLASSLLRLESALAQAGAAIVPTLRPGLDESQITQSLDKLGLTPTGELTAWYQWHDGSGARTSPRESMDIVPGGAFFDLDDMCGKCEMERTVAAKIVANPKSPFGAEQLWRSTWFPLLHLFGKGQLAVDLAGGNGALSPVHVIWYYGEIEDRGKVAWPSIKAFVDTMIRRFESGEYWVDEAGLVRGDNIDFPEDSA